MPGPKPTPAESSIMIQPQDSLSIVLPVYNEAATIERVLRDLHAKIAVKLADVEFIVAEDGSTDGTKEVLQRLAPELKLRLVTGRERKGYTRAVKDALALPTREWVFFTDSDGQQEAEDFWTLAAKASEGYDVVTGVKTPRHDPWPRLALSRGLRAMNRVLLGARFRDANCGFRLMRREVVKAVLPRVNRLPLFINTEFLLRAQAQGYRIAEVEVRHYAREDGGSRGLPPSRIPREVALLVRGLVELRGEFKRDGAAQTAAARPR